MQAPKIEEQRLGATLAFVVAGARTRDVYLSRIAFRLRMHLRVAVDLAGGGLQNPRPGALGEPQHVHRPDHARLHRLHGVALVVDGRGRAGEVVDAVDLDVERERHVMAQQLELPVRQEVGDVGTQPGREVVGADDLMALAEEQLA